MLLALPLDIWEIIFERLPGQDLQVISKVPRLRVMLAVARRSAHRLEVHRAGLVDVSRPGSRPLVQLVELLKAYRARWESLRWTEATHFPPRPLWIYHFAGNVLVHIHEQRALAIKYIKLPSEEAPASSWEDDRLDIEHGIKTFSAYPGKNLLAVIEEWPGAGVMPYVRLHIRRLNSARDIVVLQNGQLKVCQPFTTNVDLDVDAQPQVRLSYEIEQTENHLAVLFACYTFHSLGYCAKFIMWDLVTQVPIVSLHSLEYRSFVFLDHRWILFGAIRNDSNHGADRQCQPYLEIMDSAESTNVTVLELDKSVVKHTLSHSIVDISVGTGAGHEEGSLMGDMGMPFIPDTTRGIITADVYLYHPDIVEGDDLPQFESYVFVMDIENLLVKVPSSPNPEQRYVEWRDSRLSAAVFSYSSVDPDQYRLFSRHSYVSGFRYASPIQPLAPGDPSGPRCFFVYDFNPYREASDSLPGVMAEDPHPDMVYPGSASEMTREVVGGLSCWRARFDLPPAERSVEKCHIALADGGVVLFELNFRGEEFITVFSMW